MSPELKEKLAGRLVVASVSGGKDSAALSLWLTEQGIEHRRVFMDTGWEHPLTYEYLRGPLAKTIGPIEEIAAKEQMEALCVRKAIFPSRLRRYCTEKLKVEPTRDFFAGLDCDAISAVGVRAAESEARSKLDEWEWSKAIDAEIWRPLLRWSEQDVIEIHKRHDLAPNPLYLRGVNRVGCWPCIFARKAEIRLMAEIDPGRIDGLRELETRVTSEAERRAAEKGEALKFRRTWFASKDDSGAWPIDKVVEWSRTSRGGRQFELFAAADSDAGCMRWGLCDTGSREVTK